MKEPFADEVRRKTEKVEGTFHCFNCKMQRPLADKRKRGTRVSCASCASKKTPPRIMK